MNRWGVAAIALILSVSIAGCFGSDEAAIQSSPVESEARGDDEVPASTAGHEASENRTLVIQINGTNAPTIGAKAIFTNGDQPPTVHWNWGDGNTSEGNPASHAYEGRGNFTIQAVANQGGDAYAANETIHIAGPGEPGFQGFDGEPADCARVIPDYYGDPRGLINGFEERTVDIVFLVESSFISLHGDQWPEVADFLIEMADEMYRDQVQLRIKPVDIIQIPTQYLQLQDSGATGQASSEGVVVLEQSRRFMNDHYPDMDRDLVFTLVGANIAGSINGQAQCQGSVRYKEASYAWSEASDVDAGEVLGPLTTQRFPAAKTLIHEIGHILGARHEFQECVTPYAVFNPADYMGACTVMTNGVTVAGFQFSRLNILSMRAIVDEADV